MSVDGILTLVNVYAGRRSRKGRETNLPDFDLLFSRLRGRAWSHVAMAGACFVFATALFVSPAWGYADFARLQQLLSWFDIAAGSLFLRGAMRISLVCSSFFPGSASSPVPCRWSPPSPCARDGRYTVSSPRWFSFFCWAACGR